MLDKCHVVVLPRKRVELRRRSAVSMGRSRNLLFLISLGTSHFFKHISLISCVENKILVFVKEGKFGWPKITFSVLVLDLKNSNEHTA